MRLRGADGRVLVSRARVSAEGARVLPGAPLPPLTTLKLVPDPDAREVRVRATEGALSAEARFPVGPPSERVELSLQPPAPVKGRDSRAELSIRMLRADGTPDPDASPPVLRVNVGAVAGLELVGPGRYRATYQLPSTRYPEVAIIVALSPWPGPQSVHGALGQLRVPISGTLELPGRAEKNADVSIAIAGVTFGPVKAGPDGQFRLTLVVPPGHSFAASTTVDRFGNTRKSKVDLELPPTDQLACVASPTRLPADGAAQARILCAASDPFGKPAVSKTVQLSAKRGTVSGPAVLDNEMLEWIYTAPRGQPEAPDELLAVWKKAGPRSRDELKLELVQGPAAALELSAREALVPAGGELRLEAKVADALGHPRAGALLRLSAPAGTFTPTEESSPGRLGAAWEVPDAPRGQVVIRGRAVGPTGTEPALLRAWIGDGQLRAAVTDLAGLPVPGQRLLAGGRALVTDEAGEVLVGPARPGRVTISHAQWPGLRLDADVLEDGRSVFPPSGPPGSPEREAAVRVVPPTKVLPRIQAAPGAVSWWIEDDRGHRLAGRKAEVAVSNEPRSLQAVSAKEPTPLVLHGKEPVTITVFDLETGVAAVVDGVRP